MNEMVNDQELLDVLTNKHPQLIDKALIDLLNGLEVVGDQLRFQKKPSTLASRIWKSCMGEQSNRQHIIDENLYTTLECVAAWLYDLQNIQTQSDLTLTIVTERLTETRLQVANLSTDLENVAKNTIVSVNNKLSNFRCQLSEIDRRSKAQLKLDVEIRRWKQDVGKEMPPIAEVFLLIDRLWWGDFGGYFRQSSDTNVKTEILEIAKSRISDCFAQYLQINPKEMLTAQDLLMPLKSMTDYDAEIVSYLVDKGDPQQTPVLQAYARTISGESISSMTYLNLPIVLSPHSLVSRLMHEIKRAYFVC